MTRSTERPWDEWSTNIPAEVQVRGAREHNLKNVDVDVPRDALVVFTGVSGSGKSSLAFGTLFAESQRRYLESVAPYARRLIDQVGVPDVDSIEGMPPAVALQQHRSGGSARSSVGSVTTLSSLVRMLYSRAGHYPADQPMLFAEDFSPNTVQGACPDCHGIGRVYEVPEQLMVPDPSLTIRDRAIASWPAAWHGQNLRDILVSLGYDVDTPWRDLPKKDRDWILYTDERPTAPVYAGFTPAQTRRAVALEMEPSYQGTFTGARRYVLDTFATTKSALMKKRVSAFVRGAVCSTCDGKLLKPEAVSVTFEGFDIAELSGLSLNRLAELLEPVAAGELARQADSELSVEKRAAAGRLAAELLERLHPIMDLGLGYLSLDRSTPTLSSGELQRLRLATQLSSQLFGVVYVLDEPSAGLHPRDRDALLGILQGLKRRGNSVFIVEHSLDIIGAADWLVDIGPGAGERGGQILYSGPPEGLQQVDESSTRRYLFDLAPPMLRTPRAPAGWLRLEHVSRNNLHDVSASFPLKCLTAVTGISGAGKSSLVSQALPTLVAEHLGAPVAGATDDTSDDDDLLLAGDSAPVDGKIVGTIGGLRRVVSIDQKPIGRTPRSNVATYTGMFDHIRRRFAETPEARSRGYKAGRFSFNVASGRCPTCEGEGWVMVELLFLPSVYTPCSDCDGTRYKASTLEITWRDRNIAEILQMGVEEARVFFDGETEILRSLTVLCDVGLGYLRLGQPATELSGGEAQRVKLATELQRAHRGDALYLLDEPSAGLHPADTDRLMVHLQKLVDAGNTVVVVELDMRVVAQADYVIDLGPGAGGEGGRVVATGTPAEASTHADSVSGPYLADALKLTARCLR
ncbi:excinuclease ABC subunit UvrA [Mycobacterium sp. CBMA293]|uniref:excinuclease ABC subunit UvrA n=2 Tax=Mycolicibacterium TaxID=1866885 RepID=UPI00132A27CA|nr:MULTISPECIES: excinuclease ABC subunit UvrA [unclassified Mycolicibacterium]MUL45167.1 excinuclease ABC subunit UvrA [Mycolicibacterium sp. CBMA 360]MUL91772.1 excinuclease ABC subunit UvrA [Mycolicibacterium sp. CBMA 230]MUL56685.1 excinuclease ABC subunit UvrA [Mycolicibacterium sp. CBMA 335]MUL69724.1 excinuclease ABC subunit UvrA [Mycolicibacterium sp. CBMA 311]MUM05511.1 excinuclease ABC subunit A [Mycolicibacterium sp. CBMA 213]